MSSIFPSIAEIRSARPDFADYSDLDIIGWVHARYNMGSGAELRDTAIAMGEELPAGNFSNKLTQAISNMGGDFAGLARAATEDFSDPQRAYQTRGGVFGQQPDPNVKIIPEEPGVGTWFRNLNRNIKGGLRDTRQLLQEGLDLERQEIADRNQFLQQFNTAPQSWDEMQFGDDEKGFLPWFGQLAAGSIPEMATIAAGGLLGGPAGAFATGSTIGTGRMAGIQQDTQGYTDGDALGLGLLYGGLGMLGPQGQFLARTARPGFLAAAGSRAKTAGYQGLMGAVGEVPGEIGQEALELAAAKEGLLTPEAMERYKEAGIGAFFLGGAGGAAIGATVRPEQKTELLGSQPGPAFPAFAGDNMQYVPVPGGGMDVDTGFDPGQYQAVPQYAAGLQARDAIMRGQTPSPEMPAALQGLFPVTPEPDTTAADAIMAGQTPSPELPAAMVPQAPVPTMRTPEQESRQAAVQRAADEAIARREAAPTTPITSATDPLTIDNVADEVAQLVQADPEYKFNNADTAWAERNIVGATPEEVAAINTRSPKRQRLIDAIAARGEALATPRPAAPEPSPVSPPAAVAPAAAPVQPAATTPAPAPSPEAEPVAEPAEDTRVNDALAKADKKLTERQRMIRDMAAEDMGPTEIADALTERTGKKVQYQAVQKQLKAIQKKYVDAMREGNLTPEEVIEQVQAAGLATREEAGETAVAQVPGEEQAIGVEEITGEEPGFGVIKSTKASQTKIKAEEKPKKKTRKQVSQEQAVLDYMRENPTEGVQQVADAFGMTVAEAQQYMPTAESFLERVDPGEAEAQKPTQQAYAEMRKDQDELPTWNSLRPDQRESMTEAYQEILGEGKVEWMRKRKMGKKTIGGRFVPTDTGTEADVTDAMNRMMEAADVAAETRGKPKKPEPTPEPTPEPPSETISKEYQEAAAVWKDTGVDLQEGTDIPFEKLSERQQEIWNDQIRDWASKPGMTEAGLAEGLQLIKSRVLTQGAAFYDHMYHRVNNARGSQQSQVEGWIRRMRAAFADKVFVEVVQSAQELPPRPDGRRHPNDVAGLFANGQVYLVADNIGNRRHALETLTHEVVGHLGLQGLLGPEFKPFMEKIQKLIADNDPAVARELAMVQAAYTDNQGNYLLDPLAEAEEVMAHIAQQNPNFGLIRELVAKLRVALAKLGLGNLTRAELNLIITRAGRSLSAPSVSPTEAVAYNRSPFEMAMEAMAADEVKNTSSGKYAGLWEQTQNEFYTPEHYANFKKEAPKRIMAAYKYLKQYVSEGMDQYRSSSLAAREMYDAEALLDFFMRDNKYFKKEDITILDANLNYMDEPVVFDGKKTGAMIDDLERATIVFHMKQPAGSSKGFIGTLELEDGGASLQLSDEIYSNLILQQSGFQAFNFVLTGATMTRLAGNEYLYTTLGPQLENREFREQWFGGRSDQEFEVYEYPNHDDTAAEKDAKEKNPIKPGNLDRSAGREYYVRWKGMRDVGPPLALAELNKFVTRGTWVMTGGSVPELTSKRQTGRNVGKTTSQSAKRVEYRYHIRQAEGQTKALQDTVSREIGQAWKTFRTKSAIEGLNLKGMIDVYGKSLPSLRTYYKNMGQMEAMQVKLAHEADQVAQRWNNLSDKEALDSIALDSTMGEVHPDVEFTDAKNKHLAKVPGAKMLHNELQRRYNELSPQAQQVYQQARDKMMADWKLRGELYADVVRAAYADAINDAPDQATKDNIKADMEATIAANQQKIGELKGPYFPLRRYGRFIATKRSDAVKAKQDELDAADDPQVRQRLNAELNKLKQNDADYAVHNFETERAMTNFLNEQPDRDAWESGMASPADPKLRDITKRGMDKVKSYLQKNVDPQTADSIEVMLAELYVGSLPENNALSYALKRQGIAGAETNMLRSFATTTEKMSFYLSRFKYRDTVSDNLREIEKEAKGSTEKVKMQRVYDNVFKRYQADLNYIETPWINTVSRLSGMYHLGSPAYWMTNATQPWLIGAPHVAARLGGMTKTLREMRKGFVDAANAQKETIAKDGPFAPLNLQYFKNSDERAMIQHLLDHGRIDINITAELGAIAGAGKGMSVDKVSNIVMMPAHQIETNNRIMLALAAYRMARQRGIPNEKAIQMVDDIIVDTQVDYSNINAPYVMKASVLGGYGKLIFQFRKYQQAMIQLIALQARAALKGDKQALAMLAYLSVIQAGIGGLSAVPGAAIGFAIANLFIDDDDEEGDAETQMRNAMTDMVGVDAATALMKGLPGLAGMDLSKRVGMGDTFTPLPYARFDGNTGRELLGNVVVSALGAHTSMYEGMINAFQYLEEGQVWKGLEAAMPKGIRDISKAFRYNVDGVTTRSQNIGLSPDGFSAWDTVQQSLGLSPLSVNTYYEARRVKANTERAINDLRRDLLRDYSFARMEGNRDLMREINDAINDFNREHRDFRITSESKRNSYRNRRDLNRVDERGMSMELSDRKLRDLTRFAQ